MVTAEWRRLVIVDPERSSLLFLTGLVGVCSFFWQEDAMNIFVGSLSFDATDADLRQAFEAFGQVTSARDPRITQLALRLLF